MGVFEEVNCSTPLVTFTAGTLPLWFKVILVTWGLLSLLLIFSGLIGNVICFLVLKQLAKGSVPYRLMLWITVFDSGRLFVDIFDFPIHLLESFVGKLSRDMGMAAAYSHPIIMVVETHSSNTSKYLLALLSVYQVLTIKRPFLRINPILIYSIAAVIAVVQLALCIPYALVQTLYYCPSEGKMKFAFTEKAIANYRGHIESYIHPTIPMVLCIVVTYILVVEIRKANKTRAQMNVTASISISKAVVKLNVVFIMCNLPHIAYAFVYFYGTVGGFNLIIKNFIIYAAVFASCFNAAINFLIYYSTDAKFRGTTDKIICGASEATVSSTAAIVKDT